jgi:hypothetical protein
VQEALMKYSLQRKRIFASLFEAFNSLARKQDKELHLEQSLKKLLAECKFVEFCLRNLGRGRQWVLETLTIVDFVFFETCFYICGFFGEFVSSHGFFRLFAEFKDRFEQLDFHQQNRMQIEQKYLFFEFGNPEMNQQIEEKWKGHRQCLIKRSN